MKKLVILLAIFPFFLISIRLKAQYLETHAGIDGLTCSMCSFSVEKALRQLDFIKDVKMDLNKNEALILFREGVKPDFEAIVKKVYESGFSVRFLTTAIIPGAFIKNGKSVLNERYSLVNPALLQPEKGKQIITFIGKKFLQKKELSKAIAKYPSDMQKEVKAGKLILVEIVP